MPTWLQKEFEIAFEEAAKKGENGRTSRISIESDILPSFEPSETHGRDDDVIQPPKLFAPTPTCTPDSVASMSLSREVPPDGSEKKTKNVGRKQSEKENRSDIRTQRIRLEPVRMPIPRLQSATSTSSLQRFQNSNATGSVSQLQDGKPNLLGLKKAYSNVDVAPSSKVKPLPSKRQSESAVKVPSKGSILQKNAPSQLSNPTRRTTSSESVKNSTPSPLSSPQRRGNSEQGSPDKKELGALQTSSSPPNLSDGSEVGSDHDLLSPRLSSSSEGEVKVQHSSCATRENDNLK